MAATNEETEKWMRASGFFIVTFCLAVATELMKEMSFLWSIGLTCIGLYSLYLGLIEISSKSSGIQIPNAWKIVVAIIVCAMASSVISTVLFYANLSEILEFLRSIQQGLVAG